MWKFLNQPEKVKKIKIKKVISKSTKDSSLRWTEE